MSGMDQRGIGQRVIGQPGGARSPERHGAPAARLTGGPGAAPGRAWPETTDLLRPAEILVLRAFRHWIVGLADGDTGQLSRAWNELAGALGPTRGRGALAALTGMVRELRHARRRLRHHPPSCACLTGDEVAVLAFVGACRRREWVLARGLAEWLVVADGVGGMLEAGARLGRALAEAGFDTHRRPSPLRVGD